MAFGVGVHDFGLNYVAFTSILYWFFVMASRDCVHGFGLNCVAFTYILYWFFILASGGHGVHSGLL